ncbi:UDP-forming cellulose synthase catalytic subunit, partial [Pseudoalteromonas sp. S185]
IDTDDENSSRVKDKIDLLLSIRNMEFSFTTHVCNTRGNQIGVTIKVLSLEIHGAFIQSTFSPAEASLDWQNNFRHDRPSNSFKDVQKTSLR